MQPVANVIAIRVRTNIALLPLALPRYDVSVELRIYCGTMIGVTGEMLHYSVSRAHKGPRSFVLDTQLNSCILASSGWTQFLRRWPMRAGVNCSTGCAPTMARR